MATPGSGLTSAADRRRARRTPMPIERVQRWVGASLVFTTIEHLSAGIALFAVLTDRKDSRVGLLVMSGICGLFAILAARLILEKSWLSPWLLVALIWPLVGTYFVYWR